MLHQHQADWLTFSHYILRGWIQTQVPCLPAFTFYNMRGCIHTQILRLPSFVYAPKQWNLLPSDICLIQSSHTFKTVKNSPLETIPQVISNSSSLPPPPPPPPHTHTFHLCRCGVRGVQYDYIITIFEVLMDTVLLILIKHGVLTPIG